MAAPRVARPPGEAAADEFGYETMFLVEARDGAPLDLALMRRHLEEIGGSVLVAGDGQAVKVHVHNEQPDQVIAMGLRWGHLSRITVENLDDQARDFDDQREIHAEAFAGTPAVPVIAADAPVAVVVVATGDGLADAFRSLGAQAIVPGGQTANPSTAELLRAIRSVPSYEVVVLPNNPNTRLAAEQAAALSPDRHVVVVPTRNAAEGIAALVACDAGRDAQANAGPMLDAARAVQTLQVTRAVRDAHMGRLRVRTGQVIALGPDDGILAAGDDRTTVVLEAVAALHPGFELVTIYYGADADEAAGPGAGRGRRRRASGGRGRGRVRRPALLRRPPRGRVGRWPARAPPRSRHQARTRRCPAAASWPRPRRAGWPGWACTRSATCSSTCRAATTTSPTRARSAPFARIRRSSR